MACSITGNLSGTSDEMAYLVYSYKFKKDVPLLDEYEWAKIAPVMLNPIQAIKDHREKTGKGLREAKEWYEKIGAPEGLQIYFEITGHRLDIYQELFAVRMRDYGALCPECDKPFRTPRAKLCAECGFALPNGKVAGPIDLTSIHHLKI